MEPELFELRREFELLGLNEPLPEQTPDVEDYLLHTLHEIFYTLSQNIVDVSYDFTSQLNSILFLSRHMSLVTYRFAQKNQPNKLWVPVYVLGFSQSFNCGSNWVQQNSYSLTRLHQNLLIKTLHPDLHEARFFQALEIEDLMIGEYEGLKSGFYEGVLLNGNKYNYSLPFLRTDMILSARRCQEDHIRWMQRYSILEGVHRATSTINVHRAAEDDIMFCKSYNSNIFNLTSKDPTTHPQNLVNVYTSVDINSNNYIQQQLR